MQFPKLTLVLLVGLATLWACAALGQDKAREDAWKRFVIAAGETTNGNFSKTDNGKKWLHSLEVMGLTKWTWILDPVLVAEGDRSRVFRQPIPEVWKTNGQLLLASGDINGDGRPEYILGAGWFGPMGGVLAVYDDALRKIAEREMECIWGIELKDLTADGIPEILVWEDEHKGSGQYARWLTILGFVGDKGFAVVWRGSTYFQLGYFLDTYRIGIDSPPGKTAVITQTRLHTEWPQQVDDKWVVKAADLSETNVYVWNKADMRFQGTAEKSSEPCPPGDGP